ncbi:hypothetical protein [Marinoscillum sp. MHG1-6]|uniref:hypothetical protein n=1 Tax=Marinoscillum sp. MHG1-6 TaxID=2959627 RepID=UPI002156F828|nr:hypothetical protein [Marinoscillum sp. MHG1-6]
MVTSRTYQDKYFKQDKNSILRAAQGFVEPQFLKHWVEYAIECFHANENPLGLEDDFILHLKSIENYDTAFLRDLYELLAAIYRLKKGNNQLEFIWDGRSHYEVYAESWKDEFDKWLDYFCNLPEFYRAIIKICVLKQGTSSKFLFYAMRRIILTHFNVELGRNKMIKSA